MRRYRMTSPKHEEVVATRAAPYIAGNIDV
jgi:hypothetical protein